MSLPDQMAPAKHPRLYNCCITNGERTVFISILVFKTVYGQNSRVGGIAVMKFYAATFLVAKVRRNVAFLCDCVA